MATTEEIKDASDRLKKLGKKLPPGSGQLRDSVLGGLTRSVDRALDHLQSQRPKRAESLMVHVRLKLPELEAFVAEHSSTPVPLSDVRVTRSGSKWYAKCAGHQFASRGYVAEHAADLMAREHESEFAHWVPAAEAE
jgi:hypothetical protein